MLALEGYREIDVLLERRGFRLVRAARNGGATVLVKRAVRSGGDSDLAGQLQREYELLRRLHHPSVVEPLELIPSARPALALVDDGGSLLRDRLVDGPLSVREALAIAIGIASGVAELHAHDIVHRDVQPDNVMVGPRGEPIRIVDLGVATVVPRQQAALLSPGVLVGSLPYLSPEQTGRTSRPVDHRTDLYSLGVTLFEMLTGERPFTSAAPLDLVHDHLAVQAPRVGRVRESIPPVVDLLVARLLEKDPEDRYRSAVGVQRDLVRIHDRLVRGLDLEGMELIGPDISTRFQMPDRLFGRSDELADLETWLHRAARGRTSLLLVHGSSGVGKTSLIEELRQPVSKLRGYVAIGKPDHAYPGPAHEVVAAACRDLVRQLLTEEDSLLEPVRRRLHEELGDRLAILAEVVPGLRELVHPFPVDRADELPAEPNQLNRVAAQLVTSIASPERPVALVLDDVHWAHPATSDFIERTMLDSRDDALLVIAAYRDEDLGDDHPLHGVQERLNAGDVAVGDVSLAPLTDDAVAEFVAASVGRTAADAMPLTELCLRNAGGNPLFVRLYLGALYEDGLLRLDPSSGAWSWDVSEVRERGAGDEVAQLATEKIASLGEASRSLLGVMAIAGTQGDAQLLSEIGIDQPSGSLRELATQGLIELTEDPPRLHWEIAHDRLREAAASLVDDADRRVWHRRIGTALQRRLDAFDSDTSVFAVLRHLNAAHLPTEGPDSGLARMNRNGGRSAMRTTDFVEALAYFSTGVDVLGADQWAREHDLAFDLHVGAAEAARLLMRFDDMDRWVDTIAASTTDQGELVEVALRKILSASHRDRHLEAVAVARAALADLGWELPERPRRRDLLLGDLKTRKRLATFSLRSEGFLGSRLTTSTYDSQQSAERQGVPRGATTRTPGSAPPASYTAPTSIFRLHDLHRISDGGARDMIRLLSEGLPAAYWTNRRVFTVMILKGLELSLEYGNDPASALFYAFYGSRVATVNNDPDEGLAYADLAVQLARTFGSLSKPGRVRLVRDAMVAPAKVPLRDIEPSLARAHRRSMDGGDAPAGVSALLYIGLHRLLAGDSLDRVEHPLEQAETLLSDGAPSRNLDSVRALRQLVHDLEHGSRDGVPFAGPYCSGDPWSRATDGAGDRATECWLYTLRAIARWFVRDIAGARADITRGGLHLEAIRGQALVPAHHLYGVLAWSTPQSGARPDVRRAKKHRTRLAWFAKHNPVQHEAALLLADGAIAAGRGRTPKAQRLLSAAEELAGRRADPIVAGIAASLAADLAERLGDHGAAVRHGAAAHLSYSEWGADALTSRPPDGASTAASAPSADEEPSGDEELDLATVVRASEAISEQIELQSLVQSLMEVVLRNAGADRAVLFRVDGDEPVPEAVGSVGAAGTTVTSLDPDEQPDVAASIVRLVARTSEPVIIARAADDPLLRHDESISRRGTRSLLCVPLVTQGRLGGLLYLENNQVEGAFTAGRVRLLQILASQAASALEKARLHEAQRRLIEAQDRFVPAQFLRTLGHSNLTDVERGEGSLKVVDILFTDIRSFTSIVEEMAPSDAMEFVNDYLAHMEPVIHAHGGFIDTYEGDSILALFDAGADAGVRAAVAMALAEISDNERRASAGLPPVRTGFGLNTASVMMGIVGGAKALRATIIGDAVNVASRIETLTKRYRTTMLISENTAVRLRPETDVTLRPLERVQLVGKTQPLQVFEVLDALDGEPRTRRLATLDTYNEALVALERGETATAQRLFGKVVGADATDTPAAVMLARTEELMRLGEIAEYPPVTRLETK